MENIDCIQIIGMSESNSPLIICFREDYDTKRRNGTPRMKANEIKMNLAIFSEPHIIEQKCHGLRKTLLLVFKPEPKGQIY